MADQKTHKLVFCALLAALTCVATMVVQIPSPTGYKNLGDCFVLLSGWLLGPWYGFAAGGIGSALADLFLGYAHYAPGTFAIKGLEALAAALLYRAMGKKLPAMVAGGAVGGTIMVIGYFGYSALILGRGMGALPSLPGNVVQAIVGLISATLLMLALRAAKATDYFEKTLN